MNELSPQAKSLFARARNAEQPASEARTRVQHRLAARLAAGAAIGVGSAAAKSAWAAWVPLLKTMAWVSLGAGVSLAGWHQVSPLLFNTRSPEATAPAVAPSAMVGPARQAESAAESLTVLSAPDIHPKPTSQTPELGSVPRTDTRTAIDSAPNDAADRARRDSASVATPTNAVPAAHVSAAPSFVTWPASESPAPAPGSVEPEPGFVPLAPPEQVTAVIATGAQSTTASDIPNATRGRSLAAETAQLREVQRAIRDGAPARALQLLDQDDARFARGVLAQERSAARVQALCKQGRGEAARAEAARFEAHWPNSVLLGRIRAECR
jgi:hypothetical protein